MIWLLVVVSVIGNGPPFSTVEGPFSYEVCHQAKLNLLAVPLPDTIRYRVRCWPIPKEWESRLS